MRSTIVHELFFLCIGESAAFLAPVPGKNDFGHRGVQFVIACRKIEDTAQNQLQFLSGSVFSFLYIGKEEILNKFAVDVGEHFVVESRGDIVVEQALVFAESERFRGFLFQGEPGSGEVVETDGITGPVLDAARGGKIVESGNEFLFEDVEVFGGDFDVDAVAVIAGFINAVFLLSVRDDLIAESEDVAILVCHFLKFLFAEFQK